MPHTPPSSHLARDDGASNCDPLKDKVVSAGEDDATSVAVNDFPLVRLDVDVITDSIAGRLATSLLGHVLYLKNQIPFPVMRLERVAPKGQNTNTRVDKLRTEFLTTFDILSSHMDTTFSALSTALCRCSNYKETTVTRAYLAILLGPSREYAKSKVILAIDGLEKRIWGDRANGFSSASDDENDEAEDSENDEGVEVPDDSESDESEEELEEEEEDQDESENVSRASSPPQNSHASEQRFLQNAVRLLSRTLADADVEGRGIISEMSPTQTHIFIRAPRRFKHPAWIPRQKMSTSLDATLCDFLDCSSSTSRTRYSKKNHVEGVWITSRAGIQKDEAPTHNTRLEQDDDEMIWWSLEGKLVGFSDW